MSAPRQDAPQTADATRFGKLCLFPGMFGRVFSRQAAPQSSTDTCRFANKILSCSGSVFPQRSAFLPTRLVTRVTEIKRATQPPNRTLAILTLSSISILAS
eukprot:5445760-Amphidinium_carterae.1